MKQTFIFFLLFTSSITVTGQLSDFSTDMSGTKYPWTNLSFNNDPRNFQFAIIADRTGGERPDIYKDAIIKLNLLQPEFVMSIGDNIQGFTTDEITLDNEWEEFKQIIADLKMPFFYLPGNHDYQNPVQAKKWDENFGRSYYYFLYKNVLFLCLNSEEAMLGSRHGGIEKPQFEYFKNVLENNKEVSWTVVFMHQPIWKQDSTRYWPELEKLLSFRKYTVFAGHMHAYKVTERNNTQYYILATTGGGSKLRGVEEGEYDHILWITMTPEGPVIANIMLDGIIHENDLLNQK